MSPLVVLVFISFIVRVSTSDGGDGTWVEFPRDARCSQLKELYAKVTGKNPVHLVGIPYRNKKMLNNGCMLGIDCSIWRCIPRHTNFLAVAGFVKGEILFEDLLKLLHKHHLDLMRSYRFYAAVVGDPLGHMRIAFHIHGTEGVGTPWFIFDLNVNGNSTFCTVKSADKLFRGSAQHPTRLGLNTLSFQKIASTAFEILSHEMNDYHFLSTNCQKFPFVMAHRLGFAEAADEAIMCSKPFWSLAT